MASGRINIQANDGKILSLTAPEGMSENIVGTVAIVEDVVSNTGNEAIAGIKTFSSSPIVPTPTTDMQVSTKKYVDDLALIHSATSKATPVDADEIGLLDSASSFSLKKLTWANLKATLLTYFDTLYSRTTAIFGIGQTWQDVTASRANGVTYTNTTGKPIVVVARGSGSTTSNRTRLTINGLTIYSDFVGVDYGTVQGIVPNNGTYTPLSPNGNQTVWELR